MQNLTKVQPHSRCENRTILGNFRGSTQFQTASALPVTPSSEVPKGLQSTGLSGVEGVSLNELFDRMSKDELETYAREGTLPDWFSSVVTTAEGAAPQEDMEGENAS